ncbi:MAG: hypothetical protein CMJ81_07525 [Planctomycetaceae bacterium]|nr:hypothetical protein [Planctomycetaceae bacterium]MBP63052.1 hypothetical protein [Planctomycetaceae bacterium]
MPPAKANETSPEAIGSIATVEPGAPTQTKSGTFSLPEKKNSFSRQEALIASLTVFILAIFIGFEIITKVPPTLHTPLMSGSNAISGITVVGALLAAGGTLGFTSQGIPALLGMLALALATVNVVGGFFVTGRMLAMFQRK